MPIVYIFPYESSSCHKLVLLSRYNAQKILEKVAFLPMNVTLSDFRCGFIIQMLLYWDVLTPSKHSEIKQIVLTNQIRRGRGVLPRGDSSSKALKWCPLVTTEMLQNLRGGKLIEKNEIILAPPLGPKEKKF